MARTVSDTRPPLARIASYGVSAGGLTTSFSFSRQLHGGGRRRTNRSSKVESKTREDLETRGQDDSRS